MHLQPTSSTADRIRVITADAATVDVHVDWSDEA